MANIPCPVYGVHKMVMKGFTVVWDHTLRNLINFALV